MPLSTSISHVTVKAHKTQAHYRQSGYVEKYRVTLGEKQFYKESIFYFFLSINPFPKKPLFLVSAVQVS